MTAQKPSVRCRTSLQRVATVGGLGLFAGCTADDEPSATTEPSENQTTTGERKWTDTAAPTPSPTPVFPDYRTTGGTRRGSVTAAIADTQSVRYQGLSDTASLPADWGMLFVYESAADRTFVMRRMHYGLDIVYADADGKITTIHHAPAPDPVEAGEDQRYPGFGQYVLEVNHGWTTEHGVAEGDVPDFDL